MKRFDTPHHHELLHATRQSPRGRRNLNWHEPADTTQRFFNLMLRGTYIRPHCHRLTGRFELTVLLEGSLELLCFDADGRLTDRSPMRPDGLRAVELGPQIWHSFVVTSDEALVLEIKPGPYDASIDKVFADWAPTEDQPEAAAALDWLTQAPLGARFRTQVV